MFSVYLFCAIVGGALMLLSLLEGDGDLDFGDVSDLDGTPDLDIDAHSFWSELPFLNLRFWIFGTGMFGITGLVLSWSGKPFLTILIGALLTGLATGWVITTLLQRLKRRIPNSLITPDDLIGSIGTIELPPHDHSYGKVRLNLKGQQVEYPVRCPTPLELGQTVIVVETHGHILEVSPQPLDKPQTDLLD
ncbi:hypothetical protein GlitD10_0785 [Gloeomargarita lithophora Alchichica-D10]|uniref:Uncharacterized protein n=1 Tax=Gloeomargarita lithophora Alchichica-D10 TaxID=1188229 RepID=A0A1J0AAZ2_9CYAN|nr:NfeD family protein [Gloeomargarita lithophora]APB33099.1 hypothetical protein GlitD10_0785 [Gloeomargarita lithophora Alchichica-D10]